MTALLYLLATIGVVSIAVMMYRALARPRVRAGARRWVGPDDDPNFLRDLADRTRHDGNRDGGPTD